MHMIAIEEQPTYAVGDVPSTPLTLTIEDEGTWTGVEASAGSATIAAGVITLTLPALDTAGILTIALTLTEGAAHAAAGPLRVVVEDPTDGWLTLDQARTEWADAAEDDSILYEVLTAARTACEAFAPPVETVPIHYRRAQLVQAKAIWASERSTRDSRIGDDDFSVTVFPLDWNVKQLLRPKSAIGGIW